MVIPSSRVGVSVPGDAPVPLFSPLAGQREVQAELLRALADVAAGGEYVLGEPVAGFERELARWLGGGVHVVGVASGTDALVLALRALGVGPGDEVVTTPLSFVATVEAVVRVGARPVFCDVDRLDVNLDAAQVADRVGPRTRALLPVHLFGTPCDLGALAAIAGRAGVPLLEDVAQALGGRWGGSALGTVGAAAAASFFPTKTLGGMGDGGAVICHDEDVAAQVRALRFHGLAADGGCARFGLNSRLDAVQAAVLRVKLTRLPAQLVERRAMAARYDAAFADAPHVRPLGRRPGGEPAHGLYTVRVEVGRDDLLRHLAGHGVSSRVYYPVPLHLQPALADLGHRPGSLPHAEEASRSLLSLPLYPGLPVAWQERVVDAVLGWRPPVR